MEQLNWIGETAKYEPKPLRAYQAEIVEDALRALSEGEPSCLIVMATGTGKTRTAAELIRRWINAGQNANKAVLWLAHRDELLTQAQEVLRASCGVSVGREQADEWAPLSSRIVVATVQTIGRGGSRANRFGAEKFGLIVVDEAHHAVASTYRATFRQWPNAKIVGLTATPDRSDELAMGEVFSSHTDPYDITDGIRDGHLCPVIAEALTLQGADLTTIKTRTGDLEQDALAEVMDRDDIVEQICAPVAKQVIDHGRIGVIFAASVVGAHKQAGVLNAIRPGIAGVVDGGMPRDQRRAVLDKFYKGGTKIMCNVDVLTEGYDNPAISLVAVARPTKSRARFAQAAGRGLRPHPGKKDCLIYTFDGMVKRTDLITPVDLLGGKYTDEEVALAKSSSGREPQERPEVVLEFARKEIAARAAKAKAAMVGGFKGRSFDPFRALGLGDREKFAQEAQRFGRGKPDAYTIQRLVKAGFKDASDMPRDAARKLLARVDDRRKKGLCTMPQLEHLKRAGVDGAENVTFGVASKILDQYFSGGRRLDPAWVKRVIQEDNYKSVWQT